MGLEPLPGDARSRYTGGMNDASSQRYGAAWQVWGILVLLFLAASVWFGLHPHYRFAAVGLALLILPVLLKRAWT